VEKEPVSQLLQYLPVLLLLGAAVLMVGSMLALSTLVGKKGKRPPVKDTAYECGMLPIGSGTPPMVVRFYLVAMLFILFDIEVVFLYPWAVIYREFLRSDPDLIFGAILSFMGVLFAGYLYILKKHAFDWKNQ
jgi:NADH-quinone oxidoreductase subunit A